MAEATTKGTAAKGAAKKKSSTTRRRAKPAARKRTPTPAQRKVEQAVSEVEEQIKADDQEQRYIEWEGLRLPVPNELPGTVMFDFAELDAEGFNPIPLLRITRELIGQEAFMEVRHKVSEGDNTVARALSVCNTVLESFGMSLGESSASPTP